MLNIIVIMGRLTKDPELRKTQNDKSVASFTLAVDRDAQDDAVDFIDVVAWGKTAEFAHRYFFKGKMMAVKGKLQSRKWQDRNGNNRVSWEVNAQNIYFADDKKRGQAQMDGGVDVYADGYAGGEPEYDGRGTQFEEEPPQDLFDGDIPF